MFGDIAHGFLYFLFGNYLCHYAEYYKKKTDSILHDVIPFRYLIILMGFFAFYCGMIYNDMSSVSFNFFGSCYDYTTFNPNIENTPTRLANCVYPFGIDPIWSLSINNLTFYNGFKMKLAVMLGIT